VSAWRTASRFSPDATKSSVESTSEASIDIEPVAIHAHSFTPISAVATPTAA
jgi:hypothetical protein